jgi:hypothetical protein
MGSEKDAVKFNPAECVTQAIKMSKATVFVSIPKADVKALKEHAGSIGSYSPTAFKLADCPTPQEDGTVLPVTVSLVLRTMNNKVPKDANKTVVTENTI